MADRYSAGYDTYRLSLAATKDIYFFCEASWVEWIICWAPSLLDSELSKVDEYLIVRLVHPFSLENVVRYVAAVYYHAGSNSLSLWNNNQS